MNARPLGTALSGNVRAKRLRREHQSHSPRPPATRAVRLPRFDEQGRSLVSRPWQRELVFRYYRSPVRKSQTGMSAQIANAYVSHAEYNSRNSWNLDPLGVKSIRFRQSKLNLLHSWSLRINSRTLHGKCMPHFLLFSHASIWLCDKILSEILWVDKRLGRVDW